MVVKGYCQSLQSGIRHASTCSAATMQPAWSEAEGLCWHPGPSHLHNPASLPHECLAAWGVSDMADEGGVGELDLHMKACRCVCIDATSSTTAGGGQQLQQRE